jgi:hypothetical protein
MYNHHVLMFLRSKLSVAHVAHRWTEIHVLKKKLIHELDDCLNDTWNR